MMDQFELQLFATDSSSVSLTIPVANESMRCYKSYFGIVGASSNSTTSSSGSFRNVYEPADPKPACRNVCPPGQVLQMQINEGPATHYKGANGYGWECIWNVSNLFCFGKHLQCIPKAIRLSIIHINLTLECLAAFVVKELKDF